MKPSEHSPATSALFAELIPKYLDPELYHVINGAIPETTKVRGGLCRWIGGYLTRSPPQVLELRWDHSGSAIEIFL